MGDIMRKTFIGPRLRQLRRDSGQTQAQMAEKLGISPAYVNLLEKNQRSLSVQVLMALSDQYNVDWRDVVLEKNTTVLSDLRNLLQDPLFSSNPPDLDELRAAIDHMLAVARKAPVGNSSQGASVWLKRAEAAMDSVVRKSLEMRVVAVLLPGGWPFRRK